MNFETLALRWCPKAERAEVTRVDEHHLRVVVTGDRITEADAARLQALMGYRLAPHGVAVDVEARPLTAILPPPPSGGPGGLVASKLDRQVLEVLAEAPMTRSQLAYRLRIGPRTRGQQRALTNALYRLQRIEHSIELRGGRFRLADVPVPPQRKALT